MPIRRGSLGHSALDSLTLTRARASGKAAQVEVDTTIYFKIIDRFVSACEMDEGSFDVELVA